MRARLAMRKSGCDRTRFVATQEAPVHEKVKQALVAATEKDTHLIMRSLRNTKRVLANSGLKKLLEIERKRRDSLTIDGIRDQVAGIYPRVMKEGDVRQEHGAAVWSWAS